MKASNRRRHRPVSEIVEAVTDVQGRFTLPARLFANPGIGARIDGPELGLFRAGYGGWQFRDWAAPLTDPPRGDRDAAAPDAMASSSYRFHLPSPTWSKP